MKAPKWPSPPPPPVAEEEEGAAGTVTVAGAAGAEDGAGPSTPKKDANTFLKEPSPITGDTPRIFKKVLNRRGGTDPISSASSSSSSSNLSNLLSEEEADDDEETGQQQDLPSLNVPLTYDSLYKLVREVEELTAAQENIIACLRAAEAEQEQEDAESKALRPVLRALNEQLEAVRAKRQELSRRKAEYQAKRMAKEEERRFYEEQKRELAKRVERARLHALSPFPSSKNYLLASLFTLFGCTLFLVLLILWLEWDDRPYYRYLILQGYISP
ncbi:Translation initiation factor IF-2 [Balamuthia mandrillaris]